MIPNGRITGWRRCTGTTGAGEPALEEVALRAAIPCEVVNPSDHRLAAAQSLSVALERVARVPARALRLAGITPGDGDRVTVEITRPVAGSIELEVVGVRPLGTDARVVEISFGVRRDGQ